MAIVLLAATSWGFLPSCNSNANKTTHFKRPKPPRQKRSLLRGMQNKMTTMTTPKKQWETGKADPAALMMQNGHHQQPQGGLYRGDYRQRQIRRILQKSKEEGLHK
ncbi:MAG: hypothetical protein IPN74_19355 [Haliscomenobacter sp.]|nr:hypothetical protein [Haliscomenobacter sp.]